MSNSSMKSIVIGAGRLGSNIAKMLSKENNDVILIDRNREKLGNVVDFTGFLESGDATDLGLLEECGIKDADRLVACTDDDNTNIFIFCFQILVRNPINHSWIFDFYHDSFFECELSGYLVSFWTV